MHCCWAMHRHSLQCYVTKLAWREEETFQTCALLNNINGSAARSKMTDVLTRVLKKRQRLSSGDWTVSALRNKYVNWVLHPHATRLHHSTVWNSCLTITSQMNTHEVTAHFNTIFWEQTEWLNLADIVERFDMANVLNGGKICFIVSFIRFISGRFSCVWSY